VEEGTDEASDETEDAVTGAEAVDMVTEGPEADVVVTCTVEATVVLVVTGVVMMKENAFFFQKREVM
jgi:hypothetical protein